MSDKEKWKAEAQQIIPLIVSEVFEAPKHRNAQLRREQDEFLEHVADALYEGYDDHFGQLVAGRIRAAIEDAQAEGTTR